MFSLDQRQRQIGEASYPSHTKCEQYVFALLSNVCFGFCANKPDLTRASNSVFMTKILNIFPSSEEFLISFFFSDESFKHVTEQLLR